MLQLLPFRSYEMECYEKVTFFTCTVSASGMGLDGCGHACKFNVGVANNVCVNKHTLALCA